MVIIWNKIARFLWQRTNGFFFIYYLFDSFSILIFLLFLFFYLFVYFVSNGDAQDNDADATVATFGIGK